MHCVKLYGLKKYILNKNCFFVKTIFFSRSNLIYIVGSFNLIENYNSFYIMLWNLTLVVRFSKMFFLKLYCFILKKNSFLMYTRKNCIIIYSLFLMWLWKKCFLKLKDVKIINFIYFFISVYKDTDFQVVSSLKSLTWSTFDIFCVT